MTSRGRGLSDIVTVLLTFGITVHHGILISATTLSLRANETNMAPKSELGSKLKSLLPFHGKSTAQIQHASTIESDDDTYEPFWMESIKHQGLAPFNSDPKNYKVFRNVKVRALIVNSKTFISPTTDRIMALLETVFTMIHRR